MSLLFRFCSIARVKRKGKLEPALDYFCPILPYDRFYPTLLLGYTSKQKKKKKRKKRKKKK